MVTRHAQLRAQQRRIPPIVDEWLDQFGAKQYDGHGCVKRFFNHRSIARMERALGRQLIQRHAKWLRSYRVDDSRTGTKITCGWLTKPIRRR